MMLGKLDIVQYHSYHFVSANVLTSELGEGHSALELEHIVQEADCLSNLLAPVQRE
jgi:hypothetical protein